MESKNQYDVAIIGAGPGGYVAGIRARQLGLKVCVVEKDKAGGVCLNWGCIPSKNLLHQATRFTAIKELEAIGVTVDTTKFDYGKVNKKSRQATQRLVKGIEFLLKKNKIPLIKGRAKITDINHVVLDDETEINAKNILIATGSRPFTLPGFEFDENQVLSSNGILAMTELPKSLVILGAGAIGCEFAYLMNAFGVAVTLVELANHILPLEDEETVAVLAKTFKKKGINTLTESRAVSLIKTNAGVVVELEKKDGQRLRVEAEKALCVFGRIPNTENLGLEAVGIVTEKGHIPVNRHGRTRVPSIYAIGDVLNTPQLAHVASREGEIAVEQMAGHDTEPGIRLDEIPSGIFCEPQVAGFGLRETQAMENNISFKKAVFPYRGIGKAVATGKPDGMIKILHDPKTNEIIGAHIVGHNATEVIHEVLLAKSAGILPEKVARMIHAHPTISELIMEGMRAVCGQPIHG